MQGRLASFETGQPDCVVLFELKERVAQFEGEKEKEKEKEKTKNRECVAKYAYHHRYLQQFRRFPNRNDIITLQRKAVLHPKSKSGISCLCMLFLMILLYVSDNLRS